MTNFKLSDKSPLLLKLNDYQRLFLFKTIMNAIEIRKTIDQEEKKMTILNPSLNKKNLTYKYKKVEKASFVVRLIALFTSPVLGFKYALIAMTLSLMIELFHTFALFSTNFGPFLAYFFHATKNILDEDEEGQTFIPKNTNMKLIRNGELNIITLHAFKVDLILMCAFFLFR